VSRGRGKFKTFSFWSDGDDSIIVSSLSTHELIGFYIQEQPEVAIVDQSIQQRLVSLLTTESLEIVWLHAAVSCTMSH